MTQKKLLSLVRNINVTIDNLLLKLLRISTINRTPNGDTSTQNLPHRSAQLLSNRSRPHNLNDLDDVIKRDVAVMFNVLHLLTVSLWLLWRLDRQSSS
ncbi:hypothetical protein Bca4012_025557 [Brassica carinata]